MSCRTKEELLSSRVRPVVWAGRGVCWRIKSERHYPILLKHDRMRAKRPVTHWHLNRAWIGDEPCSTIVITGEENRVQSVRSLKYRAISVTGNTTRYRT